MKAFEVHEKFIFPLRCHHCPTLPYRNLKPEIDGRQNFIPALPALVEPPDEQKVNFG